MAIIPLDLRTATASDMLAWRDRIVADAIGKANGGDASGAAALLRTLQHATIDEDTLEQTDPLLPVIANGKAVIATFDPLRVPRRDEVVIIYGNYPHTFDNVVVNNPIKRHVADFWRFQHDFVEHDARWHGVDRIFIINADQRRDRYDAVLRELAHARAPFDRIVRVSAFTGGGAALPAPEPRHESSVRGTIGCLRSHIEALRMAEAGRFEHALVLEDDFCFSSDLETHLRDLGTFFERAYDYWICLLATSKYGAVVPVDDLVSETHQKCTNAAGYLISRSGLHRTLAVFEEALERLKETRKVEVYAADRCWASLQCSGKFLVFSRKFGFQGSSFSDIERSISRYLD